jgi:hypothetical protein
MITRDFAQRHIDRLDGIGGVDHFANILWKGKQGDHADPVGSPGRGFCWDRDHPISRAVSSRLNSASVSVLAE